MKLVIIAGLILAAVALIAMVRKRMKRSSTASNTSSRPTRHLEATAPATRITVMPGQLTPEQMADDGDDDKYWRRYYS